MLKYQYTSTTYANEDQFQAATYQFINHNYPLSRRLLFHVPNGGMRSKSEAMKFKSMGLLPGCPDLICLSPLFAIELKMPNGVLSEVQKSLHQYWTGKGIPVHTCYSPQQVVSLCEKYLQHHFNYPSYIYDK